MNASVEQNILQNDPEIIIVDNGVDGVSCDGGGSALGHPKAWYTFGRADFVECSYCDRVFVKECAKARFSR